MLSGRSVAYRVIALVTTVVTFGCAYLFIVRPVLDTTNRAIDQAGSAFDDFGPALNQATGVSPQAARAIRQARKLQAQQARTSQAQIAESNKLLNCMREASGDAEQVQRCSAKFNPADP